MNLLPINNSDKSLIKEWFQEDPEGLKRMSSYKYPSNFLKLIKESNNRHGWIAYESDQKVGFLDLEVINDTGFFAFFISKDHRGKGLGKEILVEAIKLAEVKNLKKLEAAVEEDNTASIRVLKNLGFTKSGIDQDGLIRFTLYLSI